MMTEAEMSRTERRIESETQPYLGMTRLLDFGDPALVELAHSRAWLGLAEFDRVGAIYDFVRKEIGFGYNDSDDIPASRVLADGYGQCNTKATLLMALLRLCRVRCRLHGFTINKRLQKGVLTGIAYALAPRHIIHSWVEVPLRGKWSNLEGFILDDDYLRAVQHRFAAVEGSFCGYAVATPDLKNPCVEWTGSDTYIQREGITRDFGVFDSPDDFYSRHGANLTGVRRFLFRHVVRNSMNRNVARIRGSVG